MLSKVYVEITNRCNLQCAFCPGTKRPHRDMCPEEFSRLAPEIQKVSRFVYFHVMGEPLFHPELSQMLDIAGQYGLRVILTTNGTLLPSRGTELLRHPALHKVNISLHSMEANGALSMDAYIRGCGTFAKTAGNRDIICCLRLWNLDGEVPGMHRMNEQILEILHEIFPDPWAENSKGFRLVPRVFLEWGQRFEWPDTETQDRGRVGFCQALRDQVGILSDGTVIPCCLDHEGEIALGNAFSEPLTQILNGSQARAIYDGFSRRQRVAKLCRHCGYAERFSK